MDALFVELFLSAFEEPPESIVLDLDATDDPLHGTQEGRFFHGYYGHYCYLPLYIFCGDHLLLARLRRTKRIYCARGEMENRIKEQQLDLFAPRASAHWMGINQLRLWFSSLACTLLAELRRLGLDASTHARARCQTLRLQLFKIEARVRVTRRKTWVFLSSVCPHQDLFAHAYDRLLRAGPADACGLALGAPPWGHSGEVSLETAPRASRPPLDPPSTAFVSRPAP